MNNRDRKCCMIQCKVSAEAAERIERVVERGGFSSHYEFLQYLLSAFLKFADTEQDGTDEMSDELLSFAQIYEGWENKKNRIITTKPSGNRALKMTEAINIFSELGKNGYVCKVIKVSGNDIRTTGSISQALETLTKRLYPRMYNQLMEIGRSIDENNIQRVIEYMIEDMERKGLKTKENTVSESPMINEYGNVPKKKRSKSLYDE